MLVNAENLARWNELAAIQLFQQHPGSSYADIAARADTLALFLMNAVTALVDAEAKVGDLETEHEQLVETVARYTSVLEAFAASGTEPWSAQAEQALHGESRSE